MADSDSLQILIESVLDATGYRMNEAEAQKLRSSLGETTNSTGKLNEAVNAGAKAAEKSEMSHRALHGILRLVGSEAGPAAEAALAGVAAAATGGMLFAVMAVRGLFEWLHQAAEQAKKFKEAMEAKIDLSGLVEGVDAVKTKTVEAGDEIDKFFAKLKQQADGHEFKKIADEQIAHLQRVAEAEKKLAGEQAEREKARLEFLKSTHQITEEEYKAGVQAANDLKSKKESSIAGSLNSQSEAALSQALTNIIAQTEGAKRALDSEKGKPSSAKHIETLTGLLKATQTKLAEVEAVQNAPQSVMAAAGSYYLDIFKHPTETAKAFEQRITDELGTKMNELRAQEASLRRQIEEAKKNAPDSEKIKELEDKITALSGDKSSIDDELAKRRDQGSIDRDQGTADFTNQFLEAQSRLQHHQGSRGDSQIVAAMNQLLQTSKESDDRTYFLVKDLIAHHGNLSAALAELARQLAEVKARTSRATH